MHINEMQQVKISADNKGQNAMQFSNENSGHNAHNDKKRSLIFFFLETETFKHESQSIGKFRI
jgi:hypothetical protein